MKTGDRLYCHTKYSVKKMDMTSERVYFTVGKLYTIFNCDKEWDEVVILDDYNDISCLALEEVNDITYYGQWFYTEQEMRKLKLDKINSYEK